MALKERLTPIVVCGAIGLGVGTAVEQDTNSTSQGRIVTVDTCTGIYPGGGEKIGKKLLECLTGGVPEGDKIGGSLEEGDPREFVESFRLTQVKEKDTNDVGNILLYGLGGAALGFLFVGPKRKIRYDKV